MTRQLLRMLSLMATITIAPVGMAANAASATDAPSAEASLPATVLVLDFELNDLTLHPDTVREEKRVKTLRPFLTEMLRDSHGYTIAELPDADRRAEELGKGYVFDRPPVAARMGQKAGAEWVVSGRLHKASFLFVYLKSQLINSATGEINADFVVEIKGWEPRLTKKGVEALALKVHQSLQTLLKQKE